MTNIQTKNDSLNNQDKKQASGGEQLQKQILKAKSEIVELLNGSCKSEVFTFFGVMTIAKHDCLEFWKMAFRELVKDGFIVEVEQKLLGMTYMVSSVPEYEVCCRDVQGVCKFEPFNDYGSALKRMYELNKKTGFFCAVVDKKCAVICSVEGLDFVPTVTAIKLK
tara:strand:- start:1192 stop:1686 length:495 start_codon:yes stop_codon:yes gene_type:complete